jgi:hypothetical protein
MGSVTSLTRRACENLSLKPGRIIGVMHVYVVWVTYINSSESSKEFNRERENETPFNSLKSIFGI